MNKNVFLIGTTMRKYFLLLIASMMATTLMAQKITPQQEREFYQKAYDVINVYAQSAKLDDERDVSRFNDLFESKDLKIYNDLMSLSYEPTLTVADYVKLLHEAEMTSVVVSNVQKVGKVEDKGSVWQLSVSINKSISFVSQCNTLFDSREFFGADYPLLLTLSMDKSTGSCYISGLQANGEVERFQFPSDYRVLVKSDERDNNLDINGTYVKFNMDQKLLRSYEKLSYRGAKVREKDMEGQCDHKVYADYSDKSWRIRLGGAFALSGFNKLSDADEITASKDGETAFGIDFGYVFPTTSHLRIGVFAGVGLSMNTLTMELASGNYESDSKKTKDIDDDNYTRIYDVSNPIKQEMKATDIAVPLYLDFEYEFSSIISLYADLGMKMQTSTGKMTFDEINYTTSGKYGKEYDYLIIEKIDELGFGQRTNSDVEVDEDIASKKMTFDGLFRLGLRLNINKSLAFDAGIQYQIGGKSWKTNNDDGYVFSYTQENDMNAKDKLNLLGKSSGISHNALKVAASLIYKF